MQEFHSSSDSEDMDGEIPDGDKIQTWQHIHCWNTVEWIEKRDDQKLYVLF